MRWSRLLLADMTPWPTLNSRCHLAPLALPSGTRAGPHHPTGRDTVLKTDDYDDLDSGDAVEIDY